MKFTSVRNAFILLSGLLFACSGPPRDHVQSVSDSLTVSTLGHPDGQMIVGTPAVAQWTDGSTYVFVTAAASSTEARRLSPPKCNQVYCPPPPPLAQYLWSRQFKNGAWGAWTQMGTAVVSGSPTAGVTADQVMSQRNDGTPTSIVPARLHVVASTPTGYLVRCYLETAPQDNVVITITGDTTFSYSINGGPASGNVTIPVGGSYSIPAASTDLVITFPAPTAWQEPYRPGDSYTISPHELIPAHNFARLNYDTPDVALKVTTSTWSGCQSIPIATESNSLGMTAQGTVSSSAMLSERSHAGTLKFNTLYGVATENTCLPTSPLSEPSCQGWFDTGIPLDGYPVSIPLVETPTQTSSVHVFDLSLTGEVNHHSLGAYDGEKYSEVIPVQLKDPPAVVISPGPWPLPTTPAMDMFSRDASGQLVRVRNYALDTLAANSGDGGTRGQSDGGVGSFGIWATDAFGGHLDSPPAATLAASASIGNGASLRVWNVYGLQGQDLAELRVQEIVALENGLIGMPDPSCSVPYEIQAKLTFCKSATTVDMIGFCQDALGDIARQYPAGSTCQATMRAFHFDIWLGLIDRALPFGTNKAPDSGSISASLSYLDQFYKLESTLFPETATTSPSLSADHSRRLAEVFSQHAYAAAEAALENAVAADPTSVGNSLEQMSRATIVIDQQILLAAFADGDAPITSPALLWIMADRLDAVFQRMQHADRMHDLGCRFRDDCKNADNELAELWHVLGALPDATTLTSVLCKPGSTPTNCIDAATAMRSNWKSIFAVLLKNHARLEKAALSALGPTFTGTAADAARKLLASPTTLPVIMQPLGRIVVKAVDVYAGYARTGLYDTSISNLIDTGIQQRDITTMLQSAGALQIQFDKDLTAYKGNQRQYVQDQVNSIKAGGDITLLQAKLAETEQQLQDVSLDVEGIRLASRSEKQRESDFTTEFKALLDSRQSDPNMLISETVDFPTQLTVSADQVNHPLTWMGHVLPGSIVFVNTTGKWSPLCSLAADPLPEDPIVLGGDTGPEGYAVSYQSSKITLHSNSYDQQHNDYTTNKTTSSAYLGLGWDYIVKIGVNAVESWESGSSDSQTTSKTDTTTTQLQATANAQSGFRLDNTPFPRMPVGSLLLELGCVDAQSGYDDLLGPLFLEPQTSFVVPAELKSNCSTVSLHFVVNDEKCDLSRFDSGQLNVSMTVLQPQGTLIKDLGNAMATALGHLRDSEAEYIAEGFMTPEESTSLRSTAFADLNTACNCDSSKFEASLLGFYSKWVDSEIAELSRAIELVQRKRTLEQLTTDFAATQSELAAAQKQQALLALLPVQSLRGLPSRYLAKQLDQMVSYYTKDVYPAAKLRFPQTLSSLSSPVTGSDDLSLLEGAAWDDAFLDWADRADRAAVAINTQFDISNPPKGIGIVRVVMRFPRDLSKPNPTDGSQPWHVDPSGPAYLFPHVDPFISSAVWDEVMNGDGIAHLVVPPQDLYNPLGGSARLDCNQSAPAIHDMVLVGVLPRTTPVDNNGNNPYTAGIWNVPLDVEPNVMYPATNGPLSFVLDPSLTHYLPRIYFINEDKIDATLNTLQQATADAASMEVAAGISPFADFNFNLGAFRQQFQPPATLKDPLLLIGEWMLVLDLETKNTPTPMSWLGPCGTNQ